MHKGGGDECQSQRRRMVWVATKILPFPSSYLEMPPLESSSSWPSFLLGQMEMDLLLLLHFFHPSSSPSLFTPGLKYWPLLTVKMPECSQKIFVLDNKKSHFFDTITFSLFSWLSSRWVKFLVSLTIAPIPRGALGLRCRLGERGHTPIMSLGSSDEPSGLGLWGPKCAGPFPLGLVAIPTGNPSKYNTIQYLYLRGKTNILLWWQTQLTHPAVLNFFFLFKGFP